MMRRIIIVFVIMAMWTGAAWAQGQDELSFVPPEVMVGLLGIIAPLAVQLIKRWVTHRMARFLVSVAIVVVTGVVGVFISGQWDAAQLDRSLAIVFVACQVSYNLWWKSLFDYLKTRTTIRKA